MGLLDYHGKNLLPSVWSPDGNLTARFRAQLHDQLNDRFGEAADALLIGDAVSHYWRKDSPVDVILPMSREDVKVARQSTKRINGHPLAETDNPVFFWPVRDDIAPQVLAKHFGPVYSLATGYWYGTHVQDEMELQRPEGLLQRANWMLYRAKHTDDPFPYEWRITSEAFSRLADDDRTYVLDELKYRVAQVDRNITRLLKTQPKDIWRAAEVFDQELVENEELPVGDKVPRRVALAILHRFRYQDLLETLSEVDESIYHRNRFAAREQPAQDPEKSSTTMLRRRVQQYSDLLLQRNGGSARAVEEMYRQFADLLDNSRYILTDMRRRRIVYRLYRDYYLGKKGR